MGMCACTAKYCVRTERKRKSSVQHIETSIRCPICDLEGITVEEMNLHVNSAHLDFKQEGPSTRNKTAAEGVSRSNSTPGNNNFGARFNGKVALSPDQELGVRKRHRGQEISQSPDDENKSDFRPVQKSDSMLTEITCSSLLTSTSTMSDFPKVQQESVNQMNLESDLEYLSSNRRIEFSVMSIAADVNVQEKLTPESAISPESLNSADPMEISTSTTCSGSVTSPESMQTLESVESLETDSSDSRRHSLTPAKTSSQIFESPTGSSCARNSTQVNLRAKLSLAVPSHFSPRNTDDGATPKSIDNCVLRLSPAAPDNSEYCSLFFCPICDWNTTSSRKIQIHVNTVHLDIISPAKGLENEKNESSLKTDSQNNYIPTEWNSVYRDNKASTSQTEDVYQAKKPNTEKSRHDCYECPLCDKQFSNSTLLEIHVNSKHVDILSPVADCSNRECEESLKSPGCPVCGMEFQDANSLMSHVNGHFSVEQTPVTDVTDNLLAQELDRRERAARKMQEEKEFQQLQVTYGMDGKNNLKKQAGNDLQKAVCNGEIGVTEYHDKMIAIKVANNTGIDDGHSCTKGLVGRLRQLYTKNYPYITNAYLCSYADHYAASYGDKGWGCGYRNFQMLLSSLAHNTTYQHVLFNGRSAIPSISKIQQLIESAWRKGFDSQGCTQLGSKVANTNKWIGATEIVATLSSLRVKCQLIDFHHPTGPDGSHPKLFEWVRNYFKKPPSFKPPLYLQHQGHSRTIIGIEELKDGSMKLLIFDPSCTKKQMQEFHKEITPNLMRMLRRTSNGLKAKQYQIVAVIGVLNDKELEDAKILKSDRIP